MSASLVHEPGFPELKSWILGVTGLSYYADKPQDLADALMRSRKGAPSATAEEILARLKDPGAPDLDRLVEELTIGETFFFRHLEMFEALRNSVFPELLSRKRDSRCLRIWCAGCSVGAEPYSLSILIQDVLEKELLDWTVEIVGTDINRRFLEKAVAGAYEPWALRGLPESERERCFEKADGRWVVRQKYREGVKFRHHNLAADPFPSAAHDLYAMDLIVCRNVMIYFDQPSIQKLVAGFYDCLSPGGWLAVGHSEPHTDTFSAYSTVNAPGAVLYQKPDRSGASGGHLPPSAPARTMPGVSPPFVPPSPGGQAGAKYWLWTPPNVSGVKIPTAFPVRPTSTQSGKEVQEAAGEAERIRMLAHAGDVSGAREASEAMVRTQPLSAEAHLLHGLMLWQTGEHAGAVQSLKRCLYLRRDLPQVHYYLGRLHDELKQPSTRDYRNALSLLAGRNEEDLVPLGDGLTVGRLQALLTGRTESSSSSA